MPFDRPITEKCAKAYLLRGVLMYRKAGFSWRQFVGIVKRIWNDPTAQLDEELKEGK